MKLKKNFGVVMVLAIVVSATVFSYLILNNFYAKQEKASYGIAGSETEKPESNLKKSDVFYISLSIGAVAGIIAVTTWKGSRVFTKDAATVLLDRGLDDMTVRDVEIVRQMMEKGTFTVPELVKKTSVSRTSVWRLVRKMTDKDLVEETGEEKLPVSGRGKPGKVYKYLGA